MASGGTLTFRVDDPDGIVDAIKTLEHIRDDADHRIAALRANMAVSDESWLADAFTWLHVRTAGGCFESHRADARQYLREREAGSDLPE